MLGSSSHAAVVTLQGMGAVVSNTGFGVSAGEPAMVTVQYDDSAAGVVLGGVGTVFNTAVLIRVQSGGWVWEGSVGSPTTETITFNDEVTEDSVIFGLLGSSAALFSTSPAGTAVDSMSIEIVGSDGWFSGTALTDLEGADFSAANTGSVQLLGGGGASLSISLNLASLTIVPEPSTPLLSAVVLSAFVMTRRRSPTSNLLVSRVERCLCE